jgi:protein SCO1/2
VTRRRWIAAVLALGAVLAAGCDKLGPSRSPFFGVDVTGAKMGGELRLKDSTGKDRSLADFRGKVVTLFFGYTHCPDVCPTTLADMAKTMKLLGPDAQRVQVLFVTVDPRRDTPELLGQYVPAFDPSFIGLWGDAGATAKAAKDFNIYFQDRPGKDAASYTVDHTAQSFVIDKEGRLRLVWPYGIEPAQMAGDLKVLLNS